MRWSRQAHSPRPRGTWFIFDQCHNIEPKIPAQIRSVMNVQEATAKALLAGLREEMGLAPDPVAAYLASGYEKRSFRTDGRPPAGWGA